MENKNSKNQIIEEAAKLLGIQKGGYKSEKDWNEAYWISRRGWEMRIKEVIRMFNKLGYNVVLRKKDEKSQNKKTDDIKRNVPKDKNSNVCVNKH